MIDDLDKIETGNDSPSVAPSAAAPGYRAATRAAWISAVFCIVVLALLTVNAVVSRRADLIAPSRLQAMEIELNKDPTNEPLRRRLRALDRQLRRNYFRGRDFSLHGFYLLLGGVGVFLVSLEVAGRYRRNLPEPPLPGDDPILTATRSRRGVLALGAVLGGFLLTIAVLSRHDTAAEYARAADQAARHAKLPEDGAPDSKDVARSTGSDGTPPAGTNAADSSGAGEPAPETGGLPPLAAPPPLTGSAPASLPPLSVAPGAASKSPAGTPPSGKKETGRDRNAPSSAASSPAPARSGVPSVEVASLYPDEWAGQWPGFRGPGGAGIVPSGEYPTSWNGASGDGILWKVPTPQPGSSSPVAWGNRVFYTGGEKERREVFCHDAADGRLLWRKAVPLPSGKPGKAPFEDTGYAPATMALDGQHACSVFPDGTVACHDFDGKLLWSRAVSGLSNSYGHAASLRIYRNLLLVQMDQGTAPEDGKSRLIAYDIATGRPVWEVKRPVPNSWSTPILIRAGQQEQLITTANPWVIAYEPASGKEIWRVEILGGEVAPSPAVGMDVVFAVSQGSYLAAIRPNVRGNATKTAIAWKDPDNLPDIVSPVSSGDLFFMATSEGLLTCLDAKTGKKLWEQDLGASVHASPVIAANRLYLLDLDGATHILEVGRSYREIAKPTLGEETSASPAFVNGRIYFRGKTHLFCVGSKP